MIQLYTYIYKHIFLRFFSIIGYHELLNILIVPCATQSILVAYLFYLFYVYLLIPNSLFILSLSLW